MCLCLRGLDWAETCGWLVATNGQLTFFEKEHTPEGGGRPALRESLAAQGLPLYKGWKLLRCTSGFWLICIAQDFPQLQLPALKISILNLHPGGVF